MTTANNAFITVNESAEKEKNGPRLAVKDNIAVRGTKCTSSSFILRDYIAPYDATAFARVKNFTTFVGKAAHDAFGAGGSGLNSDFGQPKNPHDAERVPGGSSSGLGIALATGMCDLGLGTDTGGSVRAPAAYCGIVGLRPTKGLVSRHGLLDLSISLDTIGPMATKVKDIAWLLSLISGKDPKDQTTVATQQIKYETKLEIDLKGIKIAVPKFERDAIDKKVLDSFEKTLKFLRDNGAKIEEVALLWLKYSVPAYYLLMFAEFSSAMQRYDGAKFGSTVNAKNYFDIVLETRGNFLNPELKRRILLGTFVTMKENKTKWYAKAVATKDFIEYEMNKLLEKFDFIATPTMPCMPWKPAEKLSPVQNYMADLLTIPASLAGVPAISLPTEKFVGFQLMGQKFSEQKLLAVSNQIEKGLRK